MGINTGNNIIKGINVGSTVIARAFLGTQKIYDQLDYPTLDLNFAATKTLDSKITFTRASSGTYFDSNGVMQLASANTPRFDHNPNTKESLGLLIEEQRTNLLWRSQDFTDPVWTKQSTASVTSNAETAPDGTLTADRITASSGFGVFQYASVTVGTSITQSIYLKTGTATRIMFRDFNGAGRHIVVNPSTGAIIETSGTLLGSGSINCGNGWFRIFFSYNADTTVAVGNVRPDSSGAAQTFIIWGAQTEIGVFPTSYISTTGSAATRAADVATMTGTNFSSWYRQDKGTFFVDVSIESSPTIARPVLDVNRGTAGYSSRHQLTGWMFTTGASQYAVVDDAPAIVVSGLQVAGATTRKKLAFTFAANDFISAADGLLSGEDITGTPPTTVAQLTLGQDDGGAFFLNGHIRRIAYYPRRLANTELQLLTS